MDYPYPEPEPVRLEGRWCRLEPLDERKHFSGLLEAVTGPGEAERFRHLAEEHPDGPALRRWFTTVREGGRLFHAVIDRATGHCGGRQALMRIEPRHGVLEIGSIYWGPGIARTRVATEALFLAAAYTFDTLGYRRFEWKCDSLNEASRRAALRFGFSYEGTFRQHMIVKGKNRDTAWFAMLDHEWPRLKEAYRAWLTPDNFDGTGRQLSSLAARTAVAGRQG